MGSIFAFSRNVAIAAHFVKVRVDLRHPFNSRRVLLSLYIQLCQSALSEMGHRSSNSSTVRRFGCRRGSCHRFVCNAPCCSSSVAAAGSGCPGSTRTLSRQMSFPARPQGVETVRGHASCLFAGCNASIEASSVVWFVVIRAKSPGFVLVGSNSVRKACIPVVRTQEFS